MNLSSIVSGSPTDKSSPTVTHNKQTKFFQQLSIVSPSCDNAVTTVMHTYLITKWTGSQINGVNAQLLCAVVGLKSLLLARYQWHKTRYNNGCSMQNNSHNYVINLLKIWVVAVCHRCVHPILAGWDWLENPFGLPKDHIVWRQLWTKSFKNPIN